jgi:RNA polymerase sigma-70 factor (ECF subfamily)
MDSSSDEQPETSSPRDDAEAAVVAGLRAGAPEAFEWLVRQYGGRMLATARRLLHNEEEAADAVQDAFLSAFRSIDRFEGEAKLGTWLHRVLINACLMKMRSAARRPTVSLEGLFPTFNRWGHHAVAVGRWQTAAEDTVLSNETRALVRRTIDALPEDYRQVLLLRDIEGLTTEETAEVLGATPGTVKTRLHRARHALRTLLEPHFTK